VEPQSVGREIQEGRGHEEQADQDDHERDGHDLAATRTTTDHALAVIRAADDPRSPGRDAAAAAVGVGG
jgi:hypothetical protein